jgi:hypothetical protein
MYNDWEMNDGRDNNIRTEGEHNGWEFVDRIILRQDKHKWTAVANKVTNLRVP